MPVPNSMPGTRPLSGWCRIFAPYTMPMPSGGVRRGIRAAGLHNLGIGRHNIVRTLGAQKLFPARKRLVHRHIIKANA